MPEIPDEPALTFQEARERYERTVNSDPFPDIPPALLNSADIYDYVRATGMIHPFDISRLSKPASYEVSIGRRYIYWDAKGCKRDISLGDDEEFTLFPNSIGFITTEEFFLLPNYIAARFNLRITNVHRGILLGTGPLVDPGFPGQLLVPLHNLTTNTYRFHQGEPFAWFEFTKLSPHHWDPKYQSVRRKLSLQGSFVPFPDDKKWIAKDPIRYLRQAAPDGIRSSIPAAIAESARSAKDAADSAESARTASQSAQRKVETIGYGAAFAGVVAVVALLATLIGLWYDFKQTANYLNETAVELHERYRDLKEQAERDGAAVAQEIETMARETEELRNSLGAALPQIQSQLDDLRGDFERLRSEGASDSSQQ